MEYIEFNGDAQFYSFQPEMSFFGKFGPNNQNFQFKPKFGI